MSGVAAETRLAFERRLRDVPMKSSASRLRTVSLHEALSEKNCDIEPWEVHSELALVCPEVSERVRELLPKRDPDAFLARRREPVLLATGTIEEPHANTSLFVAVVGHALWRLAETARIAFFTVGMVVGLALLAEALH
jgi:hypothetical protein